MSQDSLQLALNEATNFDRQGRQHDIIKVLLPHVDDKAHPMHLWLIYNLALAYERIGDIEGFSIYSKVHVESDRALDKSGITARTYLLRLRLKHKVSNLNLEREGHALLDISGVEDDVVLLRSAGFAVSIPETFSDCVTVTKEWSAPEIPDDIAIGNVHYFENPARKRKPLNPALYIIEGCEYIFRNGEGAVWKNDKFFSGLNNSPSVECCRKSLVDSFSSPIFLRGTALLVNDRFSSDNYCHWIYDYISRIVFCINSGIDIKWVCLKYSDKSFQREIINHISAKYNFTVLEDTGTRWYEFDRIVCSNNKMIDSTHPCFWGDTKILLDVKSELESIRKPTGMDFQNIPSFKRVYISRGDTGGRRSVINEDALVQMLKENGFDIVMLSGLTVWEQKKTFESAEVTIGVHGAGLTNILFMRPGAVVVELLNFKYGTSAYMRIATSLGLEYRYLSCSSFDEQISDINVPHSNAHGNAGIHVDVGLLESFIAQLG